MAEARRRAMYADLLDVPDRLVAEIVAGVLHTSPRPAPPHARASSAIGAKLFDCFDGPPGSTEGPGGWWILDEPELHIGTDVLIPDVAGWRHERMPDLPATAYFEIEPDWVCEVVSPQTSRLDRVEKMPAYVGAGVRYAWLVDPLARTLEVLRRDGDRWVVEQTHGGDVTVRVPPFEAIAIDIRRWWTPPKDSIPTPA